MDWDGYFLRYKEFSDKLRNEFLEKIDPATMERANLEFESALAELIPEIKDSVLKCAEKDFQWLSSALDDSEKKWFVASVLRHLNQVPEKFFEPMDKVVVAVKPRPELEPFFRLNFEEFVTQNIEGEQSRRVRLYREHGNSVLVAA